MRKKVLSIILGMAMLSGVLAGCGSNGGDTVQNNTAAESEASAETVDPDTENTETESEETQYPITISHAYGETVIESKPERIVTLGWGNQDTVLALGVVPVGVSAANYGYVTEHGLHEWTDEAFASLGESNPNVFDDTDGFDYEAISDAAPDVILAAYSGMTEEEYETLSAIAPVVPFEETAWKTSWREQTIRNAEGMGMKEEVLENILTDNSKVPKHGSGVGVINVHSRIQLMFGTEYGLAVYSEPDEGTKVVIHIPAIPYTKENAEMLETQKYRRGMVKNEEK